MDLKGALSGAEKWKEVGEWVRQASHFGRYGTPLPAVGQSLYVLWSRARCEVRFDPKKSRNSTSQGSWAQRTSLLSDPDCVAKIVTDGGVDYAMEMAGGIVALTLAYAIGRRGNTTICAGLPPHDATFPVRPAELVF